MNKIIKYKEREFKSEQNIELTESMKKKKIKAEGLRKELESLYSKLSG